MKRKINITFLNSVSSLLLQVCLIFSTFIIPKIILSYFGSEVNGLTSSLTQFLSYISLIEGGITGVVMASLYKPLHDKNEQKISSIIKTASKFYQKIGLIFVLYALALAVIYPLVTSSSFSFIYVFSLTLILSISLLIQYTMSLSIKTLLNADKKVYIVSFTQAGIVIFSIILAYISVKIFPSIHFLKLVTGILYIIQPIVFNHYTKKYYNLDKNVKEDKELLKNRWSGFAVNLAAFIHNSTDIVILTLFTDLQTVSVYSVYALVTAGLRSIVQSIARGVTPSIGHSLVSGNDKKLNADFDSFELLIFALVFGLFSVASLLITPFVMIYTDGVMDANYNQPLFGILILISEACYLIREHHVALAYSANKFREITLPCFIEAAINIVISIILVNWLGILGVAIGTIIAMSYRSIYHVFFTKKLIGRPIRKFLKNLVLFGIASAISIAICSLMPITNLTIMNWIIYASFYTAITGVIFIIMMICFYRQELKRIVNLLKRKG